MPGTYPRSTNPYFPFDRLAWVETQLNLFHDLMYSSSFGAWARCSVYTTYAEAQMVADILNGQNKSRLDGRYVVVPANEIIVWCRAMVFNEESKVATPSIENWSAPVAKKGFIIVWEPKDQVVLTESAYISKFGLTSQIDRIIKIVRGSSDQDKFIESTRVPSLDSRKESQLPIEYEPVRKLPFIECCTKCGETKSFCRCT
jgi:hypothetical protein